MPNYYEINEETARRAKEAYSWDSYKPGSATAEYRAAVDQAAEIAEQHKKRVSPFYHERIDAAVDRYAKRLADWTNDHNRNIASCPSSYITGGSNYGKNFGRKHEKQQGREDQNGDQGSFNNVSPPKDWAAVTRHQEMIAFLS